VLDLSGSFVAVILDNLELDEDIKKLKQVTPTLHNGINELVNNKIFEKNHFSKFSATDTLIY
jgi:hypothetical protein